MQLTQTELQLCLLLLGGKALGARGIDLQLQGDLHVLRHRLRRCCWVLCVAFAMMMAAGRGLRGLLGRGVLRMGLRGGGLLEGYSVEQAEADVAAEGAAAAPLGVRGDADGADGVGGAIEDIKLDGLGVCGLCLVLHQRVKVVGGLEQLDGGADDVVGEGLQLRVGGGAVGHHLQDVPDELGGGCKRDWPDADADEPRAAPGVAGVEVGLAHAVLSGVEDGQLGAGVLLVRLVDLFNQRRELCAAQLDAIRRHDEIKVGLQACFLTRASCLNF